MHWTDIRTRRRDGVLVVDLRGHLTLADEDRRLMPVIARLLDAGDRRFLLNLSQLAQIDSTGVGEMVGVFTRVRRLGGDVKLCEVAPRVQEILEATRLDTILENLGDELFAVERMTGRA